MVEKDQVKVNLAIKEIKKLSKKGNAPFIGNSPDSKIISQ
jgi:hypothetical protein